MMRRSITLAVSPVSMAVELAMERARSHCAREASRRWGLVWESVFFIASSYPNTEQTDLEMLSPPIPRGLTRKQHPHEYRLDHLQGLELL